MKKIFSLLLLCAAVAAAPGCKDKNETPQPDPLPEVSDIRVAAFANRAVFEWTAPADGNPSNTVIRIKPQSDDAWLIEKTIDKTQTSYQITELDASKAYTYSIQTENAAGERSEGVIGEFTTVNEALLQKLDAGNRPLWSIAGFSSQENRQDNGYASNAIDGNNRTFWTSVSQGGDFGPGVTSGYLPQYIIVDLNQEIKPTEILLYRRDGAASGPTSVKIETSVSDPTDEGAEMDDRGTYTLNGGTENGALPCALHDIKAARYVKITILEASLSHYASLREVDVKAVNEDK